MNFLKRTTPLLITAAVGFVLIVASFIPATVGWGEVAAVWFDILAAVAFILGGGNLLKVQLKKISDRSAGWGYAMITLLAFLVTLIVGLIKVGAPPAPNQEFYGQVFADFPLEDLPDSQTFRVPGEIPHREVEEELPASVRRQLSGKDGQIVFKGWIRENQIEDLNEYDSSLKWRCAVEHLAETAQPTQDLKGKISFLSDHETLAFKGAMTDQRRSELLKMNGDEAWESAVNKLSERSHRIVEVKAERPPSFAVPKSLAQVAMFKKDSGTLAFEGPMSTAERDALLDQFPVAVPLTDEERTALREDMASRGEPLNEEQLEEFNKVLDGLWTADQLIEAINAGGAYQAPEKDACEMLSEIGTSPPAVAEKPAKKLNAAQEGLLRAAIEPAPPGQLTDRLTKQLEQAGPLSDGQKAALKKFLQSQPTIGDRNRALYFALLKHGPLTPEQKDFLLAELKAETAWQEQIVKLFKLAHQIKYRWSGDYREQGTPFWWIYEYLFKPLTATMFSLLAFYVASAAFRAFRAKNLEATLLLGTAFIILLGRVAAGVWLTSWMPESLSGLRIENLAVYIMIVFNTAGNRAIMIGIALGIASTSLKVLLGIDRSYLGSSED